MLFLFFAALFLAAAVYLVGEIATAPARNRQLAVRRAATYGKVMLRTGPEMARFHERVVAPLAQKIARLVLRANPKTTVDSVSGKLLAAGMTMPTTSFLAGKGFLAGAGAFCGLVFGGSLGGFGGGFLFAAGFAALGFFVPDFLVGSRARKRRDAIGTQLPDALDLLAVSVEAGLGFDGALTKITEHMEGPLVDEFALTLGEIRIGESRQDALKKMAGRVSSPELASFVRAIVQADQLGISLGRILRVQAADSRNKRQMAAEEKAMKAPVKMLFPTVTCIFPAMFIVILGPAFLNLSKVFAF
jgi:tight adherence protein C